MNLGYLETKKLSKKESNKMNKVCNNKIIIGN